MKNKMKTVLTIMLAGMTLFLANCSKNSGSGSSTANNGYVQTQYGLLPTEYCASRGYPGYGYYQPTNQCLPAINNGYNNGTSTCNGQSGYATVNGTCLPTAQCAAIGYPTYGGQLSVTGSGQLMCYPPNYQGTWY